MQAYRTTDWEDARASFFSGHGALVDHYKRSRSQNLVSVRLPDGQEIQLSPGRHNQVQKAILEDFAPRFSPGSKLLYVGDTAKKNLYVDRAGLSELGIQFTDHDKLPDVVLYDSKRNWLFLVEATTSHDSLQW